MQKHQVIFYADTFNVRTFYFECLNRLPAIGRLFIFRNSFQSHSFTLNHTVRSKQFYPIANAPQYPISMLQIHSRM